MTATQYDLDRRLDAWFAATDDAGGPPPVEPLADALSLTRAMTPRPARTARFGSHWVGETRGDAARGALDGLRPALVFAVVALLAVAIVGGAMLVGSRRLDLPWASVSPKGFGAAPDLPAAMAAPILAALPDDQVLVIDAQTDTAVIYDPVSGATEPTGPLVGPGQGAGGTTRLADGRILVLGDGVAQIFDPETRTFSAAGAMVMPRSWPVTALLPDGHVLVAGGTTPRGGYGVGLTTTESFDPETGTFTSAGSLALPREVLATLPDGRVFAVGGECCSAEVYDPTTDTSRPAGTLPNDALLGYGCCSPARAVVVPDGRVFVFGGIMREPGGYLAIWDPAAERFTDERTLPGPVWHATLLDDGRVLLFGGGGASWAGILDPVTGEMAPIEPPSAWHPASTTLASGRVLVAGGLLDGELRPDPAGSVGLDAPPVATVEILR